MPTDLLTATAASALSLNPAAAITFLLGSIAILLGIVVWFLQREIKSNDEAHRQLKAGIDETRRELKADVKTIETDVKQLLAGQLRIEGLLEGAIGVRSSRWTC